MKKKWTSKSCLPGGDFEVGSFAKIIQKIHESYNFLDKSLIARLFRLYGTETFELLKNKTSKEDLGHYFGHDLYAFELDWGIDNEWVTCSEDFLWRRTKLGLRLDKRSAKLVEKYIQEKISSK